MTQTVTADQPTVVDATATGVVTHTIGIEPMTAAISDGSLIHQHARTAIVERVAGEVVRVIATDNDGMPGTLQVRAAALAADSGAVVAAAVWPHCGWCGLPDNLCADTFGHGRLGATREARLLSPADVDDSLIVQWTA